MSEIESERRSASPSDFHKYRPSVQDNPYPQEEPPATTTSSVDANSTTPTTSPPAASNDQHPPSQASSDCKDDSPMEFHYPQAPRRATWAGEQTQTLYASHFRPDFTQPPAFSHLDAAEALSHLPLATKFPETDGSSVYSLASSSSLPILSKRSSTLSLTMSTPGATTSSQSPPPESPTSAYRYESFSQVPRLPPILQVERTRVTTSATQAASAQRRRNDATFKCPVPGHLRSHTEEKPYICSWPECAKGFARQHDCKRHQALHTSKSAHLCPACEKSFSRMDALNRHLRSSATCRQKAGKPGVGPTAATATTASGNQVRSTPTSTIITNSPATSQSSVRPSGASASASPEADDGPSPTPSGYNSA
ncbi:hypothetical protein FRC04_004251 [Tulasnella sp. 424]|nr:hypothetical protein FRC04_004251 [Tulasnella sp. 424]